MASCAVYREGKLGEPLICQSKGRTGAGWKRYLATCRIVDSVRRQKFVKALPIGSFLREQINRSVRMRAWQASQWWQREEVCAIFHTHASRMKEEEETKARNPSHRLMTYVKVIFRNTTNSYKNLFSPILFYAIKVHATDMKLPLERIIKVNENYVNDESIISEQFFQL